MQVRTVESTSPHDGKFYIIQLAPSTSLHRGSVPALGSVGSTTGDTCAAGYGKAANPQLVQLPAFPSLHRRTECSEWSPTLVRVVHIGKRSLSPELLKSHR